MRHRRSAVAVVAATILLGIAGCGAQSPLATSAGPNRSVGLTRVVVAANGPTTGSEDGVPGVPINTKFNNVPGAPFKIPAFSQFGNIMSEAFPALRETIRDACGDGTVCIEMVLVPAVDPACLSLAKLDPPMGTVVERGSILRVIGVDNGECAAYETESPLETESPTYEAPVGQSPLAPVTDTEAS